MKNNSKVAKTIKLPFSITWPKEGLRRPQVQTSTVLINGILITCIVLSIVSGFIDLVFFSNLSKSLYELFGVVSIPAGVLMSLMSIGFTLGKFFCAMQLGAIDELQTRLRGAGYTWWKNLNKLKLKWNIIHKFLIGVSIITSISLSVVSIGSGITRNANTLKQIDTFIEQGTRYSELVNTANNTQLTTIVKKASDTSEDDGIRFTQEQMNTIRPMVEDYKVERAEFEAQFDNAIDWNSEWKGQNADKYWTAYNDKVNAALQNAGYGKVSGQGIKALNLATVEKTILNNYLSTHKAKSTDEVNKQMGELKDSTLEEASAWIATLNSIGFTKNVRVTYTDDKGREKSKWTTIPVEFDTDPNKSTKVLVDTALTQLKAFRVDVENDSGDIGSSSKIFMLIGSWFDNAKAKRSNNVEEALTTKVSTGMGSTEIMMMILIMLFGIVQEFLIALFTPKSLIDRKMLSRFNAYFDMTEFKSYQLNKFMLETYKDYLDLGIINQKDFEEKAKKCVSLMEDSIDDVIARYSKKNKPDTKLLELEDSVKDKNTEIEVLKAKLKEVENSTKEPKTVERKVNINTTKPSTERVVIAPKKVEQPKTVEQVKVEQPKIVEQPKVETPAPAGFSSAVDDLVGEIEGIN